MNRFKRDTVESTQELLYRVERLEALLEVGAGVDPDLHTHSKLVGSDSTPDPALSADANGYLSAAVQPLFSAYNSVTDANVTGDGTSYTIICDTEVEDRNGNYNAATGIFTAPVTSKHYIFFIEIYFTGLAAGHTSGYIVLVTSNRNYYIFYGNPTAIQYGATGLLILASTIEAVDMDAADTARVEIRVAGGAKAVSIAATYTHFGGALLI